MINILHLLPTTLKYSQPKYLCKLFHYPATPLWLLTHSFPLLLLLLPLTSHLKFSYRSICHAALQLWNNLFPEISASQPILLLTHHHLPQAVLSITHQVFHSKLKSSSTISSLKHAIPCLPISHFLKETHSLCLHLSLVCWQPDEFHCIAKQPIWHNVMLMSKLKPCL